MPESVRQRVTWTRLIDEPYRIFFPLGALWSLIGVFYWVLKDWWGPLEYVSSKVHVWTQIYGFMGCFVIGFLATALPRFTRTRHFHGLEVGALAALSTTAVVAVLKESYLLAHAAFFTTFALLVCSLVPRFLARKAPPPVTFVFVPFALLAVLTGSGLMVAVRQGFTWRILEVIDLASNLLFQGFVIFLLLGVGGFLIRSILGWLTLQAVPGDDRPAFTASGARFVWLHLAAALLVLASFPLESFFSRPWGAALRAAVVTIEAVWQIKVHRRPVRGEMGAQWLRWAILFLVAGLWGDAVISTRWPVYRLAFLHLCFVGGFSMSTLAVAARVILSHGGFREAIRRHYWPLSLAQALVLFGLVARFGADFSAGASYSRHLVYAAASWCLGMLVWCVFILTKVSVRAADE